MWVLAHSGTGYICFLNIVQQDAGAIYELGYYGCHWIVFECCNVHTHHTISVLEGQYPHPIQSNACPHQTKTQLFLRTGERYHFRDAPDSTMTIIVQQNRSDLNRIHQTRLNGCHILSTRQPMSTAISWCATFRKKSATNIGKTMNTRELWRLPQLPIVYRITPVLDNLRLWKCRQRTFQQFA